VSVWANAVERDSTETSYKYEYVTSKDFNLKVTYE
jgi:hypothetical protein